jgi:hypothetical protein
MSRFLSCVGDLAYDRQQEGWMEFEIIIRIIMMMGMGLHAKEILSKDAGHQPPRIESTELNHFLNPNNLSELLPVK